MRRYARISAEILGFSPYQDFPFRCYSTPLPWEAAYLAGRAFRHYRARGGDRSRVLADFLIGAHAATGAMTLITRDCGYARHFQVAIEDPTERKVDDDA